MFSCLAASPKKKLSSKKQLSPSIGGGGGGKISTRKLLARVLPPRQSSAADAADDSDSSGGGRAIDGDLHSQLHALLKHLQRSGGDRLAKLAHAIETGTSGATDCVRLDPSTGDGGVGGGVELQLGRHRVNARQLCLRAWRYPDLSSAETLTPFTDTCCSMRAGQCINPFHFYRTVSAAPDLQGLLNRLIQLEQKLPLIALSDNEVSSSGCSSDSLLSASRKSWLTTGSSGMSTVSHQRQRDDLLCGGGSSSSCSCCSCCCCSTSDAQSSTAAASSCLSGPNRLLSKQRAPAPPLAEAVSESEAEQPVPAADETWCAIAYWQGRSRIGHLVRVRDQVFRVCQRAGATDAVLSLEALSAELSSSSSNQHRQTDPDGELARQAVKTRAKIGSGVALVRRRCRRRRRQQRSTQPQLQRHLVADDSDNEDFDEHEEAADEANAESTELIIFNQSEHAVFVHSPTLQPLSSGDVAGLTAPYQAVKLPPGFCLKAFDSTAAGLLCRARRLGQLNHCAPAAADPFTVRLSFVKGFGAAYQRQDIIYCPCWLEIMLSIGA